MGLIETLSYLYRIIKTQMKTITMKNPITDEMRFNLLVSALEGGSNYWYLLKEKACTTIRRFGDKKGEDSFVDKLWKALKAGKSIEFHDLEDEDNLLGTLTLEKIYLGEQIMAEKYGKHFGNILSEDDDAETGDIWLQCALLGEVVYG